METREEIQKQIAALEKQIDPLKKKLSDMHDNEALETDTNIRLCQAGKYKFNPDDLVFSAFARCQCGAGVAYPKTIGVRGAWYCSDILLGQALPKSDEASVMHDAAMPFAFYEIKSENQPSANGATTRGTRLPLKP